MTKRTKKAFALPAKRVRKPRLVVKAVEELKPAVSALMPALPPAGRVRTFWNWLWGRY